jgi:hypothetical protein
MSLNLLIDAIKELDVTSLDEDQISNWIESCAVIVDQEQFGDVAGQLAFDKLNELFEYKQKLVTQKELESKVKEKVKQKNQKGNSKLLKDLENMADEIDNNSKLINEYFNNKVNVKVVGGPQDPPTPEELEGKPREFQGVKWAWHDVFNIWFPIGT